MRKIETGDKFKVWKTETQHKIASVGLNAGEARPASCVQRVSTRSAARERTETGFQPSFPKNDLNAENYHISDLPNVRKIQNAENSKIQKWESWSKSPPQSSGARVGSQASPIAGDAPDAETPILFRAQIFRILETTYFPHLGLARKCEKSKMRKTPKVYETIAKSMKYHGNSNF